MSDKKVRKDNFKSNDKEIHGLNSEVESPISTFQGRWGKEGID